ncbi:MAG: PAS domain S-box protein [Candidatus Cloacimonetes bacterium]|nr:PAS domain S-box protein [Candidatus Cloacimonadota bacterium]
MSDTRGYNLQPRDLRQKILELLPEFKENLNELKEKHRTLTTRLDNYTKEQTSLEKRVIEGENIKTFLHSILENIYTGVLAVDKSGVITVFNKAAEEITGYRKVEILGRSYQKVFTGQTPKQSAMYALTTGKESFHRRKVLKIGDRAIEIEYSITIVYSVDNEVAGVVEAFNDISEIKKLQERIRHIETLAALGEMAASVAHEIRNPLGGIGGFAGLLNRQMEQDDPRRKLLKPIIEGVSRLNSIVSNLLTYTRPRQLKPAKVVLQDVLRDVFELFCMSVSGSDKKVDLRSCFSETDYHVNLDTQLFQQIMMNLLKNSWEAIEESGVISISTKASIPLHMSDILEEEEKEELLRLFSMIDIEITDTGSGIPEENLEKLFNPFFTTKETGNGLGLAICKKIIQLHRGDISVKSELGKGTTFTITLPLYETYEKEDFNR